MTAPVLCRACRTHWIKPGSPYYERRIGPKCGGRLRKGRRRVVRVRAPARRDVPEQLVLDLDGEAG